MIAKSICGLAQYATAADLRPRQLANFMQQGVACCHLSGSDLSTAYKELAVALIRSGIKL